MIITFSYLFFTILGPQWDLDVSNFLHRIFVGYIIQIPNIIVWLYFKIILSTAAYSNFLILNQQIRL